MLVGLSLYAQEEEEEFVDEEVTEEVVTEQGAAPSLPKIDPDKVVKTILESYQAAPEEEVAKVLEERIRVLPIGPLFKENSKWFTFFARVLRDEKAVPGMFAIVKDRNRLLTFLGLNILIFIAGYMWKKSHKNTKDEVGFVGSLKRTLTRVIVLQISRIALFIIYFKAEITPFWEITKKTFF